MLHLATNRVITRDQFKVLPMPDLVVTYLTACARKEGYTRSAADPGMDYSSNHISSLPTQMAIDGRVDIMQPRISFDAAGVTDASIFDLDSLLPTEVHQLEQEVEQLGHSNSLLPDAYASESAQVGGAESTDSAQVGGVDDSAQVGGVDSESTQVGGEESSIETDDIVRIVESDRVEETRSEAAASITSDSPRYPTRYAAGSIPFRGALPSKYDLLIHQENDASRAEIRRQLALRSQWRDTDFAFTISVRMALKTRGAEATPVIMAELQQMVDKQVWHGVHLRNLSTTERKRIIRSSMFLKDKYLASGTFDRFKARLVAGGDMQDKTLYDNLSSPTASTTSVLTVAAIAAAEGRHAITIDIGGAFLNADLAPTGITVHMRLDKVMTALLVQLDPSFQAFVEDSGTAVVQLDKALYGCVEAAALWYYHLRGTITADGFLENPYDQCIFNKLCADGSQTTIVLHVDDLLVTNVCERNLDTFYSYLKGVVTYSTYWYTSNSTYCRSYCV